MVTSTTVTTQIATSFDESEENHTVVELNCRVPEEPIERSVTWDPDTVDNEHLNRKSSKSCCIFTGKKRCKHKPDCNDDSDTDSSTSDPDPDDKPE